MNAALSLRILLSTQLLEMSCQGLAAFVRYVGEEQVRASLVAYG